MGKVAVGEGVCVRPVIGSGVELLKGVSASRMGGVRL